MRSFASLLVSSIVLTPLVAFAFPFGGQIQQLINCYNQAIYAYISAPVSGPYIWVPSTKTYNYGPPAFNGQWLLGLASAPYYCLVSISPVVTYPGVAIIMMGSSGSAAGATYVQNGQAGFSQQVNPGSFAPLNGGNSFTTGTGNNSAHPIDH